MRQFLALDLPAVIRVELEALRRRHAALRGWRWIEPGAVHLTLRFLGDVDDERDRAARPAWRAAVRRCQAPALRCEGLGTFRDARGPRVLWLGLRDDGDRLAPLVAGLEATARAAGWAPERRRFRPHLTVARRSRGTHAAREPRDGLAGAAFVPADVVLFRSDLGPDGARYTALERFPFDG